MISFGRRYLAPFALFADSKRQTNPLLRLVVIFLIVCAQACATVERPDEFPQSVLDLPNLPYELPETNFTDAYIAAYDAKFVFETHEVIELGNILITLSLMKENGHTGNWYIDTDYYREVENYFSAYTDHALFDALAKIDLRGFTEVAGLRETGLAYKFDGNRLAAHEVFSNWWPEEISGTKDRIAEFKPLIEDFVKQSNYRAFYAAHQEYYDGLSQEMASFVPIEDVKHWLDREFPLVEYNSIRVFFSPLTKGSHSGNAKISRNFTQNLTMNAGPEYVRAYSDPIDKSVIMTRQIFTEIDHNYVDFAMIFYLPVVMDAFSNMEKWTQNEYGGYANPASTFSEYMTWSAFLLFAREYWGDDAYEHEKERVIKVMEENRNFHRFGAFYEKLTELYDKKRHRETLAHLVPAICAWARTVELE